jgi:hypothetical protein
MKLKPVVAALFATGLVATGVALAANNDANDLASLVNNNQFGTYVNVGNTKVKIGGMMAVDAKHRSRKGGSYAAAMGKYDTNVNLTYGALYFDAPVNDWVNAHLEVNYDNAETVNSGSANSNANTLAVPEAYVFFGNFNSSPLYVKAGKQILNFGRYKRFAAMPTVTQTLSEATGSAATFGFVTTHSFYGSLSLFRGKSNKGSSTGNRDHVGNYAVDLGYSDGFSDHSADMGWRAGVSYLHNIYDINAFSASVPGSVNSTTYSRKMPAISVYGDFRTGPFDANMRVVSATKRAKQDDWQWQTRSSGSLKGAKPWAYTLEGGYSFSTMDLPSRVSLSWQHTGEAAQMNIDGLGDGAKTNQLPHYRVQGNYTVKVQKNTDLALNVARDRDYNTSNGGTGRHIWTSVLRLAVKF